MYMSSASMQLLTGPVVSGEAPGVRYLLYLRREARLSKVAASYAAAGRLVA